MECFIHYTYVKFEINMSSRILLNYLFYFQQWNLDQDINISNLSIGLKLTFLVLVLGYNSKFSHVNKDIFWFLQVALGGLLIFSNSRKRSKTTFFKYKSMGTSKFFTTH